MAILRTVPLKDATATALTSCGQGTIYDVGAIEPGKKLYAGLHIISCSTGGLKVRLLVSSSSGDAWTTSPPRTTERFAFTCSAQRTAEWLTPLTTGTTTSTFQKFVRTIWEMTTSGESYKFLSWYAVQ